MLFGIIPIQSGPSTDEPTITLHVLCQQPFKYAHGRRAVVFVPVEDLLAAIGGGLPSHLLHHQIDQASGDEDGLAHQFAVGIRLNPGAGQG